MIFETKPLAAGLHFVATPIGTARDITLRGLDTLASADVLAAEDTRTLRHLMELHGVPLNGRHVYAYHDHNGAKMRPKLIALMREGKSLAYASEAGTPLVADPGFALARDAIAEGIPVTSAPGPSAMIAALTIAGLPSDRFLFAGFVPEKAGAREKALRELADLQATLIFYESPKRLSKTLTAMCEVFGTERQAAVCRELTKRFEEVARGTLEELQARYADQTVKGEIVVLVDRPAKGGSADDMDDALRAAMKTASVKDAAAQVAADLGLPKRQVYQAALALDKGDE